MEVMNGKISVIIPVYNAENYLRETLSDLINQSYQDMEFIVLDDGSVDGSAKIIQEYALKDKRIQFIQLENGGPSKARNLGLNVAKGEYIRFVDADDRIPTDSVSNMMQVFEKNSDIDLVIGNFVCDSAKGYFTGEGLKSGKVNSAEFAEIFIDHVKSFYFGVPWNKLYKREIIEKYQIRFDENIDWCEDFLFNVKYFSKCKMMYFLNLQQGVYQYCTRDTGITSNVSKRELEEIECIDVLRYNAMKEYSDSIGLLERFELEWKYTELYQNLAIVTKYFRNDYIWVKYKKFKDYIREEDAYQYICIKAKKTNYKVWHLLKESCETKKYLKVFLYFIIKGFGKKYLKNSFPKFEKSVQENEEKKL